MQNLAWTGASMLKRHPCIPRPLGSGVSVPDSVQVYALFVACRVGADSRWLSNTASAAAVMAPRTIIAVCFTDVLVISNFEANQSYTVDRKTRAGLFSPRELSGLRGIYGASRPAPKETPMANVQDISRELLVNEARNLHAIQKNAKAMMKRVIDRLDDYPEAKQRLIAHLSDKENEMLRLEHILADLGQDPSSFKDSAMSAMGAMAGAMTGGLEDDILKSSMVTYGLASYEICAYEEMILLAGKADQPTAIPLLKACLSEEKAMAEWLHEHLAPTLERYLKLRNEKGHEAAH